MENIYAQIIAMLLETKGADVIGEMRLTAGSAPQDIVEIWNAISDLYRSKPDIVINTEYIAYITGVELSKLQALSSPFKAIDPEVRVLMAKGFMFEHQENVARGHLLTALQNGIHQIDKRTVKDLISAVVESLSKIQIANAASFTKIGDGLSSLEKMILSPQLLLPFKTLENALPNGLQQGEMLALIMETGAGKTAFALHWASMLVDTHYVLYITSETQPAILTQRLLRYGYEDNGQRMVAKDSTIRKGIEKSHPKAAAFYETAKQIFAQKFRHLSFHYQNNMLPSHLRSVIMAAKANAVRANKELFVIADYIGHGFAAPDSRSGNEWSNMVACATEIRTVCSSVHASALVIQQANPNASGYERLVSPAPYGGVGISQKSQVILSAARSEEGAPSLNLLKNSKGQRVTDALGDPILMASNQSPVIDFYILKANSGITGFQFPTTFVGELGMFFPKGEEVSFADTLPVYFQDA